MANYSIDLPALNATMIPACPPLSFFLSPLSLYLIPYTLCQVIIKYYSILNISQEKSAKVPAILSDKEVESKITVGKGGGNKKDRLFALQIQHKAEKTLAGTPKKNLGKEMLSWH